MEAMRKSSSRRFPVTVTHLPVTRCQICRRTVAYRPGSLNEVLTEQLPPGPSRSARSAVPVTVRGDLALISLFPQASSALVSILGNRTRHARMVVLRAGLSDAGAVGLRTAQR